MSSLAKQPFSRGEWSGEHDDGRRRTYVDIGYPWRAPAAPTAHVIEARARAWVVERGLVSPEELPKRFDPVNVGLLTALCYPRARPERQELIAQLLAWIFIQDDVFDEAVAGHDPERLGHVLAGYSATLRGQPVPDEAGATLRALASLRDRIAELASPAWLDWFCESMRGFWIDGILAETRTRAAGVVPDRAAYTRLRIQSIGVLPFLDLVEFAGDFALPRAILATPQLLRLRLLTAQVIAWANDVFSYEKEEKAGDPNNLVIVLMHHERRALVDAVDRVVRAHDECVRDFERATAALPFRDAIPRVDEVVQGHRDWMRGALDWQLASRRYANGRELLDVARRPRAEEGAAMEVDRREIQ